MKYGLIGGDLSYTYSKLIHNFLGYDYELIQLEPKMLNDFMLKKDFLGINVTNPYKQMVIPYCETLSEYVNITKSTNTLINKEGRIFAYNTDTTGFIYTIHRAGIKLTGRKVMILGKGATSRSVKLASNLNKARDVVRVGRDSEINYENCYEQADVNIIVNATPVGTLPNKGESLVDLTRFKHLEGVIDVVYNPLRTPLLLQANQLGVKYSSGLPMLAAQAKRSSELFTDKKISSGVIEDIIEYITSKILNIVLIGMPGCGKTAIGRALAANLKRDFFDTDGIITAKTGKTPSEIITEKGETAFRKTEREAIYTMVAKQGSVISLGGGAVHSMAACEALKQNSLIIYIDRDLDKLDMADRPISVSRTKLKLFSERNAKYEKLADAKIRNEADIDEACSRINSLIKSYIRSGFSQ